MKKFIPILAALSLLSACASPKVIDGKTYPTYGLANPDTNKSDKICYKVSVGNIFWIVIGIETILLPIYLLGWQLYEPSHKAGPNGECGIDAIK